MEPLELIAHLEAQLRVEIGERLIHEEDLRLRRKCPGDRDSLLLPPGELRGIAVHEHADVYDAGALPHPGVNLLCAELPLL